ncbi:MAG TPA: aminotransferase class III-fold pyridoxal phosphate-dependent enzyme [Rhodanobacteraceae bacterium]
MLADRFDHDHLWHPRISPVRELAALKVARADGATLTLADGRRLIDGDALGGAAILGYNHAVLNAALTGQLAAMAQAPFGGLTHVPAIELGQELLALTQERMAAVLYAVSEAQAMQAAQAMARDWQRACGRSHRSTCVRVGSAEAEGLSAEAMTESMPLSDAVDESSALAHVDTWLDHHADTLAAVQAAPLGIDGHRRSPRFLAELARLCHARDVLLIDDETGPGLARTDTPLAGVGDTMAPDIVCVGQAVTGACLPFAATLASREVADAIGAPAAGRGSPYGATGMANPLACAVALAVLGQVAGDAWAARVAHVGEALAQQLAPLAGLLQVADIRVTGAMATLELVAPIRLDTVRWRMLEVGLWLRPRGRFIHVTPPLVIDDADLARLCAGMQRLVSGIGREDLIL